MSTNKEALRKDQWVLCNMYLEKMGETGLIMNGKHLLI